MPNARRRCSKDNLKLVQRQIREHAEEFYGRSEGIEVYARLHEDTKVIQNSRKIRNGKTLRTPLLSRMI